jgi:hypothetical protein
MKHPHSPASLELDDELAGIRQQIEAVMASPDWELPTKRRALLEDLARRLRHTSTLLEAWLAGGPHA